MCKESGDVSLNFFQDKTRFVRDGGIFLPMKIIPQVMCQLHFENQSKWLFVCFRIPSLLDENDIVL